MCRATIIGNAGGGKSTLCKRIVKAHDLPLYAVDRFQWKPNWTRVPEEEVASAIRSVLKTERWMIDGWGPWDTIVERFEESDTIIFVDHPVWVHLWWATKRQIKAFIDPRLVENPEGCDLVPMTWKMYRMIWYVHKNLRPKLSDLVDSFRDRKVVHHIRSPRELKLFAFDTTRKHGGPPMQSTEQPARTATGRREPNG